MGRLVRLSFSALVVCPTPSSAPRDRPCDRRNGTKGRDRSSSPASYRGWPSRLLSYLGSFVQVNSGNANHDGDPDAEVLSDLTEGEKDFVKQPNQYEVFLMSARFKQFAGLTLPFGLSLPIYHTETIFCKVFDVNVAAKVDAHITLSCEQGASDPSVCLPHSVQSPTGFQPNEFSGLLGKNPFCVATGFPGIWPRVVGPKEPVPRFFSEDASVELYYMGVTTFNMWTFLDDMFTCGNWGASCYNPIQHNCNDFTDAILKGLGFSGLPTWLSPPERRWFSRYFDDLKVERGYARPVSGSIKCVGIKCVSNDNFCSDFEQGTTWLDMMKDLCSTKQTPAALINASNGSRGSFDGGIARQQY